MLDLTFLATGFRQHVFTRTGEDDGWVYKVPVAFGRILPFDIGRLEATRPRDPLQRAAQSVLIRAPGAVRARLQRAAARERPGGPGAPLVAAARAAEVLCALRDRLLVAYFVRRRLRDFQRMLGVLEHVAAQGADHVLLPSRTIPRGRALLRVDGAALPYEGPILMQRRAGALKVREQSFRAYDWGHLIAAQQLLWRHGVALVETGEILGPRSWTVLDGRLCLADTSSLTRSYRRARGSLSDESLEARERIIARKLSEQGSAFPVAEYFRFIRAGINPQTLDRLWATAVRPRQPARG